MAVSWKRGDTPLPWNAGGADLTGLTVEVRMRDAWDNTAPVYRLEETVLPGTTGDLTVVSADILEGDWEIEVRGVDSTGELVVKFPNDGTRQILYVQPGLGTAIPLP